MDKRVKKNSLLVLIIGISTILAGSCNTQVLIMSYNVENLFDDVESGNEYPEYRKGVWDRELFHIKLKAVAEVINRASKEAPDIIALQEVENWNALKALRDRYLSQQGYHYAVIVPQEDAATTVAFLSRVPILRSHVLAPGMWEGRALRNILEVEIEYNGCRLYLFNNHWKSKSGGAAENEEARLKSAELLRQRIIQILRQKPDADILVIGDFNQNVEEYLEVGQRYRTAFIPFWVETPEEFFSSIFLSKDPWLSGLQEEKLVLYETWYELPPKKWGSYVYQGKWQTPDHILLSQGLFDGKGFFYKSGHFQVMRSPFLLVENTGFPKRWLSDKRRLQVKGYSDHLPVLITLNLSAEG